MYILRYFLRVLYACPFRYMADYLHGRRFCSNPADHDLVHLLHGSCNANLQHFNILLRRREIDVIIHNVPQRQTKGVKSGELGGHDSTNTTNSFTKVMFINNFYY